MRLQKFLAQVTALSRRAAERAIAAGEVQVNGAIVTRMGVEIDPRRHTICWRGMRLRWRADARAEWVMFYKPKQTIVSKSDPQGRTTIWQRLPAKWAHLDPVGRLDYDSEGLLLLTTDGDTLHRLTHPRFGVEKVYMVKVQRRPGEPELARLLRGLKDAGELLQASAIRIRDRTARNTWLEMMLTSGKYREIRRMCEQLGFPVLKLKRVRFGPLTIGDLQPGKYRTLTPREVRRLREGVESAGRENTL